MSEHAPATATAACFSWRRRALHCGVLLLALLAPAAPGTEAAPPARRPLLLPRPAPAPIEGALLVLTYDDSLLPSDRGHATVVIDRKRGRPEKLAVAGGWPVGLRATIWPPPSATLALLQRRAAASRAPSSPAPAKSRYPWWSRASRRSVRRSACRPWTNSRPSRARDLAGGEGQDHHPVPWSSGAGDPAQHRPT